MDENKELDSSSGTGLRLSLMGSEGSGKTCFFAGLAWLGSAANDTNFVLNGRNQTSQAFVNDLKDTLARNELPPPSHKTDDLALDVLYNGVRIGIDIENFAGEEFRDVGTDLKDDSHLFSKFIESKYLILFLDIENDVNRDVGKNAVRLDAVLNLLSTEKLADGKRKLAVVLTKSDLCGFVGQGATSSAARKYLKKHKSALLKKIERLGYEKQFFFLAPIGRSSLADGQPPAPFGYEAIFDWLVGDLRNERTKSWLTRNWIPLAIAGVVLFLIGGMFVRTRFERHLADRTLDDPGATIEKIVWALGKATPDKKDIYIDSKIAEIEEALPSVDSLDGLKRYQDLLGDLKGKGTPAIESRLSAFERKISVKREELHLQRILALKGQGDIPGCRKAIGEYHLDTASARLREGEVKEVGMRLYDLERQNLRAKIRSAVVQPDHLGTLKARCDRIEEYLEHGKNLGHMNANEKKEAARAVAIARLFLADAPYHITIKNASGLPSAHHTKLTFCNLGPSHHESVETAILKSRNPQWNKSADFRWKPSDRVQIEWHWKSPVWGAPPTLIGKREFAVPRTMPWMTLLDALSSAKDAVDLNPETGAGHARLGGNTPRVTIVCDEFPNPAEDKRLFKLYIVPGTYWED